MHAKPSRDWWWAELRGVRGYVPASYLRTGAVAEEEEEEDASLEDPWQDEEYFGSYGTLVRNLLHNILQVLCINARFDRPSNCQAITD